MAGRRATHPDEAELFERVLADARPLGRGKRKPPPPPRPPEKQPAAAPPPAPRPQPRAPSPPPETGAGLDRRLAERLKRGQLPIEARLDLHGQTLNDAFASLERFVLASAAAGRRCLLVVTGKGPAGGGALKREVPQWLGLPALRPLVLATAPAQPKDGGTGALYVLLRRKRRPDAA